MAGGCARSATPSTGPTPRTGADRPSDLVERLRNNAELAADRGTTTIANEVVEKIAAIAAREVPGVYDLGGDVARLFASVKERIGLGGKDGGESADQGVKVKLKGARPR